MKVDNSTLNFLSRGAEYANGPRSADRIGTDVFGSLFESRARPVERSQRKDAAGAAAASSTKSQRAAQRDSSDDAIDAIRAGEPESPERNVEESDSKRPDDTDVSTDQHDQPEVGQADAKTKGETSTDAEGGKSGGGQADKAEGRAADEAKQAAKPVVTAPAADRPVTNPSGEPKTEADQAAQVLDQLRQPLNPSEQADSTGPNNGSPAQAGQAIDPNSQQTIVAPAVADAVDGSPTQASVGASDVKATNSVSQASNGTNAGESPATSRATAELTTPNLNAQAGDEQGEQGDGDAQAKSDGFAKTETSAKATNQAAVTDVESASSQSKSQAPGEPTVRMPGAPVHVAVDDGGAASRPLGQAGPVSNASLGAGPQTPLPEADATRVTDRVVKSLNTIAANRGGTVTLRLTPPDLGTLRIQVTMSGGSVQATFEASTAAVGRVIEQNAATLRHSLEGQGLQVERINVQVNTSNSSNASAQQDTGDSPTDGRSRGMTDGGGRQRGDSGQPNDQSSPQAFNEMLDLVA
jgi:flagellar hook-length control protein FliK